MTNGLTVVEPEIPARRELPGMIEVAQSRAAQEVQAAMLVAKRFPRNPTEAFARIMQACKRVSLAEQSQYAYPRGGTRIEGPSIRLAEVLLQNWGNCESGVIELERRTHESLVMAYAVDLESNSREVKVFTVPHIRERGDQKGGNVLLNDPRDIYEMIANQAARRKRACMLAIMPGDIVEAAVDECNKTLKGSNKEPLIDRTRRIVAAFMDFGVTSEMLQARLGHTLEVTTEAELVGLRKIFESLKDGMSKPADWFDVTGEKADLPEGKQPFGFKGKTQEAKGETQSAVQERGTVQGQSAKAQSEAQGSNEGGLGQAQERTVPGLREDVPSVRDGLRSRERRENENASETQDTGIHGSTGSIRGEEMRSGVRELSPGKNPSQGLREREIATPAGSSPDRAAILVEIDELENHRKMSAASRAGLWKQHCGGAKRQDATMEQLLNLRNGLRIMAGGQSKLI